MADEMHKKAIIHFSCLNCGVVECELGAIVNNGVPVGEYYKCRTCGGIEKFYFKECLDEIHLYSVQKM